MLAIRSRRRVQHLAVHAAHTLVRAWARVAGVLVGLVAHAAVAAGPNLLTNPGFESGFPGSSWSVLSPGWVVVTASNPWAGPTATSRVAQVTLTDASPPTSQLILRQDVSAVAVGRLYEFSFYIRHSPDFRLWPGVDRGGYEIDIRVAGSGHVLRHWGAFHGAEWTLVTKRFAVPRAGRLELRVRFDAFDGWMQVDDFSLRDVTPTVPEAKSVDYAPFGMVTFLRNDLPVGSTAFPVNFPPYAPGAPGASALVVYQRDPDYVMPSTIPAANTPGVFAGTTSTSTWYAGVDEVVPVTVGVYTDTGGTLTVTPPSHFLDEAGAPAFSFAGTSRVQIAEPIDNKLDLVGEDLTYIRMLESCADQTTLGMLPARTSTLVRVLVRVPAGTAPGDYTCDVQLAVRPPGGAGAAHTHRVRINVSDVRAGPPADATFVIDPANSRWAAMTIEQATAEIREIAAHGFNAVFEQGAINGMSFPPSAGAPASSFFAPNADRLKTQLAGAGIRGLVLRFGNRLESKIWGRLQGSAGPITPTPPWSATLGDLFARSWTPVARYFHDTPEFTAFWSYGQDEPHTDVAKLQVAIEQARFTPEAVTIGSDSVPVKYLSSTDIEIVNAAGGMLRENIDTRSYAGRFSNRRLELAVDRMLEAHADGQDWWCRDTTPYASADGNIIRNRYLGGFLFWKMYELEDPATGAKGARGLYTPTLIEAFPLNDGQPDDFDVITDPGFVNSKDFLFVFRDTMVPPRHPSGLIDTPQWEGMRQGYIDFCYASSFMDRYRAASQRCRTGQLAAHHLATFRGLIDGMPWALDTAYMAGPDATANLRAMNNIRLNEVRRQLRDMIVSLDEAMRPPQFADEFESGALGAWTAEPANDPAHLGVDATSVMCGSYALRSSPDALVPGAFVRDETPEREGRVRVAFSLGVTSLELTPANGPVLAVMVGRDDDPGVAAAAFRVHLKRLASGGYAMRIVGSQNAGLPALSTAFRPVPLTPGSPVAAEVRWRAASTPGGADGVAELRVNGETIGSMTTLSNGEYRVDALAMGAVNGFSGASAGSLLFDAYAFWRD